MARPLRIQYPGALYHVTCRGNARHAIFIDDEDRQAFLTLLHRSREIYLVTLYAYVLMDNHFHLLVATPHGNLAEFMRHFNISYTGSFNRRHERVGHLYQGRYKSVLVEQESYLSMVSRYIHLNPIRVQESNQRSARQQASRLLGYSWSSLPGYLEPDLRQPWLDCSLALSEYGGDNAPGRAAYWRQIESDIENSLDVKSELVGQSLLGSNGFVERIRAEFLETEPRREQPAAGAICRYHQKDELLRLIEEVTGKNLQQLKAEKGDSRRLAMDLLYRHGGLKGPEIGALFGLDYCTVSQERKRLRQRLEKEGDLAVLMREIEGRLSTMKI